MTQSEIPDAAALRRIAEGLDRRIAVDVRATARSRSRRSIRSFVIGSTLIAACGIGLVLVQWPTGHADVRVSCYSTAPSDQKPIAATSLDPETVDAERAIAFCATALAAEAARAPSTSRPYSVRSLVACGSEEASIVVVPDPGVSGSDARCRELGYPAFP